MADKLLRKNKEGKKRQEDLKTRRQQEMIEKVKKREERVRRVAEKQAALRQKEEEKKRKIKVRTLIHCGGWLLYSVFSETMFCCNKRHGLHVMCAMQGQQSQDPSKKVTIKKAKENEEKNKKLKEVTLSTVSS